MFCPSPNKSVALERSGIFNACILLFSVEALKKSMWLDRGKHGLQRMASNQGHLCQTLLFCVRLYCFVADFIVCPHRFVPPGATYSTVTDFAKLRGLSTSVPLASAVW